MTEKRSTIRGKVNIAPPWEPCDISKPEHQAIHALFAGEANKDQQMLFLQWFKRATAMGDMEFSPLGDRESAFASGKRHIGRLFFSLAQASLPPTK
jgi:hypothetical protein